MISGSGPIVTGPGPIVTGPGVTPESTAPLGTEASDAESSIHHITAVLAPPSYSPTALSAPSAKPIPLVPSIYSSNNSPPAYEPPAYEEIDKY